MQNINVNIVPDNFPQTIRYSQGDIGRQFKINVTDFDIPVGATVKIQATKPSGFGFSVAGVVAGSSVTFTTTAEMTDEAGRFQAELQITAGDDVIGTANFLMIGERNPHPEGTTDGSQGTIIPELTLLVERVEAAASSVLDMEVVATTLPAGSQATYSYDEALNKATFGIPEGQAGAGAAGVVASAYSAAKTYKVGDYVLYNSNLYRCTTAITTAEAFTAAHWTQIVLANDVSDLKSDLGDISESNKNLWTANASYTFVKSQVVEFGVTYPAGRYCISAVCTSTDTDVSVCRISIGGRSVDLSRGSRASGYFDASSSFDSCTIFAGQNSSTSAGDTATWADIQLEVGAYATDYVPHRLTAKDEIARAKINSLVKYVATNGSDLNDGDTNITPYATLAKAISAGAETIYIAKGTYSASLTGYFTHRNLKIVGYGAKLINEQFDFRYSNIDITGLEIEFDGTLTGNTAGYTLLNCNVKLTDCIVKDASDMCFNLNGSKATLIRCVADGAGVDGFSGHDIVEGYISEGTFIDCIAKNCTDDGLSYHEDGIMKVHGGEYYNNGSCGIASANNATLFVQGARIYENGAGIECYNLNLGETLPNATIIGCIINNNNKVGDVHATSDIGYGVHAKAYHIEALANGMANNNAYNYKADSDSVLNVYTIATV